MTIKSFERALDELSESIVHEKANIIDKQYKISVAELTAREKYQFVSIFLKMNTNLDVCIQEYLDDACQNRMYAETQWMGGFDE